jgi:hypothetical protein
LSFILTQTAERGLKESADFLGSYLKTKDIACEIHEKDEKKGKRIEKTASSFRFFCVFRGLKIVFKQLLKSWENQKE